MGILRGLLLAVEVIVCLLLIFVILMQKSKSGGGMGTAFGGGMSESIFGSRAGNVLTKMTVILTCVFLLDTLALALISKNQSRSSSVMDDVSTQGIPTGQPGATLPGGGGGAPLESVAPGGGGAPAPAPLTPAAPPGPGAGAAPAPESVAPLTVQPSFSPVESVPAPPVPATE